MKKLVFAIAAAAVGLMLGSTPVRAQGTGPADHLLCYQVKDPLKLPTPNSLEMDAVQQDFTQKGCSLVKPVEFCVPAVKTNVQPPPTPGMNGAPLQNDFVCYTVKCKDRVKVRPKQISDQFGQRLDLMKNPLTVCVPAAKAPAPECGGTNRAMCGLETCSDPTQVCKFFPKTAALPAGCRCVTPPKGCAGSAPPQCGGDCSATPNTTCQNSVDTSTGKAICACLPPPTGCGFDALGNCTGTCTTDPTRGCAKDSAGNCTCAPPTVCDGPPGPAGCPGTCPLTGQQCHPDASTGNCTCGPTGCSFDPNSGSCSVVGCPPGEQCRFDPTNPNTCKCVQQTTFECAITTDATTGQQTCGGTCPAGSPLGSVCGFANGACTCLVPTPPPVTGCVGGTSATGPTCGGTCPAGSPPGSVCGFDSTNNCTCLSPVPGCGPVAGSNPLTCNGGACPAPETCQVIGAAGTPNAFCGCQ